MKCKICNKEFVNLGNHLRYKHDLTAKEYYNKYLKKDKNEGICPTCGKETQFLGVTGGYRKFCSVSCSRLSPETQAKYAKTNIERYGDPNPARFGSERFKAAIKEKYGFEYISQVPKIKDKKEQTFLNHYGIRNNFCNSNILKKAMKNSGGYSSWEKYFKDKCIEHNITFIQQYFDDRYPFNCDFYFPDSDTFIEINGHWTHGFHWFDKNNPEDLKTLNTWKEKAKNNRFYRTAINVWTKKDLKKKEIAEQNNLNYIVLWSLSDINNFFIEL